ncbi:hypothetical protein [Conexibacter arvalis]|uniref:Uncharacterized protein n=1 Tax=Conexibacter arvalis TaxID=912552 RepID=A0A840I734_9ACTN|nr:hypothetical protein [Conexibacter arvalis]MBB4660667.1 hypothetical protein [Conexibacter arvalis]
MTSAARLVDPFGLGPAVARLPRRAARRGCEEASRAALAALERALRSRVAADAVDLVMRSPLVDRVVATALDDDTVTRLAARVAEDPATARMVERALDSRLTADLVAQALESAGAERLVAQLLDSRLLDASVARVLASEELWRVVEEIARSPAVTEAIAQQGSGLADQVAEEVGERSRRADARLERFARRFLHRPPPPDDALVPLGRAGPS